MFPLITQIVGGLTNTPHNRLKFARFEYEDGTSIELEGPSIDVFFSEASILLKWALQAIFLRQQELQKPQDENSPAFLGTNFREHVKKLEDDKES